VNVEQTQHALFRQLDVASLVALQASAADQAQRQHAISAQRLADHAAASIAQAEGAAESARVGQRQQRDEEGGQGGDRGRGSREEKNAPLKDAPNPGPLGHHLDIVA